MLSGADDEEVRNYPAQSARKRRNDADGAGEPAEGPSNQPSDGKRQKTTHRQRRVRKPRANNPPRRESNGGDGGEGSDAAAPNHEAPNRAAALRYPPKPKCIQNFKLPDRVFRTPGNFKPTREQFALATRIAARYEEAIGEGLPWHSSKCACILVAEPGLGKTIIAGMVFWDSHRSLYELHCSRSPERVRIVPAGTLPKLLCIFVAATKDEAEAQAGTVGANPKLKAFVPNPKQLAVLQQECRRAATEYVCMTMTQASFRNMIRNVKTVIGEDGVRRNEEIEAPIHHYMRECGIHALHVAIDEVHSWMGAGDTPVPGYINALREYAESKQSSFKLILTGITATPGLASNRYHVQRCGAAREDAHKRGHAARARDIFGLDESFETIDQCHAELIEQFTKEEKDSLFRKICWQGFPHSLPFVDLHLRAPTESECDEDVRTVHYLMLGNALFATKKAETVRDGTRHEELSWSLKKDHINLVNKIRGTLNAIETEQFLRGRYEQTDAEVNEHQILKRGKTQMHRVSWIDNAGTDQRRIKRESVMHYDGVLMATCEHTGLVRASEMEKSGELDNISRERVAAGFGGIKMFNTATISTREELSDVRHKFRNRFQKNDATTLCLLKMGQTRATNAYGTNCNAVVAVGCNYSPAAKEQLGGRIGRPVAPRINDVHPHNSKFLKVHAFAPWCKAISTCMRRRAQSIVDRTYETCQRRAENEARPDPTAIEIVSIAQKIAEKFPATDEDRAKFPRSTDVRSAEWRGFFMLIDVSDHGAVRPIDQATLQEYLDLIECRAGRNEGLRKWFAWRNQFIKDLTEMDNSMKTKLAQYPTLDLGVDGDDATLVEEVD